MIEALDQEQRRELALFLQIKLTDFWQTNEEYAKLFTKPEIVEQIGDRFDGPDVPAGEWRTRMVDFAWMDGAPPLALDVWSSPIDNICKLHDEEPQED